VKVIGFRQHGTRRLAAAFEEMTPERLDHARFVLEGHGLRDVVVV
jgi:hypothetical protein